ncbi:uncharacterized protein LOC110834477 isoform X2 [Zootermopsis nevadensis]|uniref:Odorant receptor n=1 Tax=Zootermopsis nevadensis TaxID=136037 RepID=A0A067R578_ZOONE|nr:uncharacterized protein LOC110834477 isoform X2 [Zootermopsis nevadensis]KDR14437.1 hypothetical protein L798_11606 [Zootermopsis nevadensis]
MISALSASENEHRDILSKLDSFNPLLILLNVSGMLPPLRIYSSRWKTNLYNVFSGVTFLSYIPLIVMQIMGIFEYSGNLLLVTVIIFQLAAYFDGMVTMAYFIYHRKRLLNTFYSVENKFNPFMQKVGNAQTQKKIILGNKKFERIISFVAMAAFLADMCTWCVLPSIVRYLAYFNEEEGTADVEVKQHLEYFILVMWLPQKASEFPCYEILYIFQFFSVWGVVSNYAAGKLIIVSLYYHLSSHFRILASAIEDIDVLCNNNTTKDECNTFSEEMTLNTSANDTNVSLVKFTVEDLRRHFSVTQPENISDKDYTFPSECTKIFSREDVLSTAPEHRSEVTYLTHCIKFHQVLLKFCVEVNDFLSNILLFDLIIFQILMCLPPLQLILGQNVSMVKFVSSIVDTGIWPLLICFWGEDLSQQSLSVQKAAYGCSWYNRSQRLKKLLQFIIMRTKKPVRMTAGKFYYISLETFADIENKVYAYFTILKNST